MMRLRAVCRSITVLCVAIALLLIAPSGAIAVATTIYESALIGPSGTGGGSTISRNQFIGVSFSLTRAVRITEVGGDMGTSPGGTIFGAVVPIPSPGALPDVAPLQIESIALASTVFSASAGHPTTIDFRTPLFVDLDVGNYALIFGSGLFGATGEGYLGTNNIPTAGSVAFTTDNSPAPPGFPLGRWNGGFSGTNLRLLVAGETLSVAEPSAFFLMSSGIVALAGVLWRKQRRDNRYGEKVSLRQSDG